MGFLHYLAQATLREAVCLQRGNQTVQVQEIMRNALLINLLALEKRIQQEQVEEMKNNIHEGWNPKKAKGYLENKHWKIFLIP